jgi:hypothetical protein
MQAKPLKGVIKARVDIARALITPVLLPCCGALNPGPVAAVRQRNGIKLMSQLLRI